MPAVENLAKGLRPSKRMPRNSGFLTTCNGAVGRDGVLQIMDELSRLDTSAVTMTFPYPQIFVFSKMTIVCSQTTIYEWVSSALVSKLVVTAGLTWRAVEFGEFVYMSNGVVSVERSADTKTYSLSSRPVASAICNYNGQVFIGATEVEGTAPSASTYTAKSIIIDCANNWGSLVYMGLRAIEFKKATVLVDVAAGAITCYGDELSSDYLVDYAFTTGLSKTGTNTNVSWLGSAITNTRIICVFDATIEFDQIDIVPYHGSGGQTSTTRGIQDAKIYLSTDAITSTTYDEAIANSTKLYDGTFKQHTAVDEADTQTLVLL